MRILKFLSCLTVLILSLSAQPTEAQAQNWTEMVDFSGYLSSDLRFSVEDYRGAEKGDGYQFTMNRNDVNFRLAIFPHDQVQAVIETTLRFYGFNTVDDMNDLMDRKQIDPFHVQLDEAYIHIRGFLWENIDFKIGRFSNNWGTADQFNPTDNLNARDFHDTLDYATKIPNQMIQVEVYPVEWMDFSLTWVPLFQPSQLPTSSPLGFAVGMDDAGCFETAPIPPVSRAKLIELMGLFGAIDPCTLNFLTPEINTVSHRFSMANSQVAVKTNFHVFDAALEMSLSYYYGRFSFPVPYTAVATVTQSTEYPDKMDVLYAAELLHPRMQVAGFDFSYSASWFFDVGFIGELAVIFPEEVTFAMRAYQGETKVVDSGEPSYPGEPSPGSNVPSDPFVKATLGMDYTFTSWLYMNAMYVRGFFDEFNDMYGVHNYFVFSTKLNFFEDEVVILLSQVLNCDDLSAIFYPQLTWIVYPSVELISGAQVFLGPTEVTDPVGDALYDLYTNSGMNTEQIIKTFEKKKPNYPPNYASAKKLSQRSYGHSFVFVKAKFSW